MAAAIEFKAVSKVFGGKAAVNAVSAVVPTGAVYGFLGNNGAGKTTAIRLSLGLLTPTAGQVSLWGRNPTKDRRVFDRVGALLDTPGLYDRLSGRENLEVARLLKNLPRAEIDRVLELVRMTRHAGKLVAAYSSGMKQRLALARCLLGAPDLLVLDEPTNALDPEGILEIRDLLRRLPTATGATVFVSSHILSEIEHIATHIGILHGGRLRASGPIAEYQRGARMRVDIDRAPESERHHAALSYTARQASPSQLEVELPMNVDARSACVFLNRSLVQAGFEVSRLQLSGTSLAEIFERLTVDAD